MALLSRDDLRYPSFLRRPLILGVLLLFVTAALLVFSPLPGSSRLSFTSSEEVVFDDMSKIPGQAVQAGRLAGWLESRKQLFLDDLRKGKLKGWTIAMGNEAGDLDSIASSISLAILSDTLQATRTIPLILTPSPLMSLRRENLLALERCQVPESTLLNIDALPAEPNTLAALGAKFALVDHNALLPPFRPNSADGQSIADDPVEIIIDHHDDEGQHESAAVREIKVPTGSCASLVTDHFRSLWKKALSGPSGLQGSPIPPEVATLLLSAIMIDTSGLKAGGKGMDVDYASSAFLFPISSLASDAGDAAGDVSLLSTGTSTPKDLTSFTTELQDAKFNISDMSTHDLLLRDYKEYTLPTASSSYPTLQVGLSTVPMGLKSWLERDGGWTPFMADVNRQMNAKSLDIEGVLTSFNSKKGKHKREVLLVVKAGGSIHDSTEAAKVLQTLGKGLHDDIVLELGDWIKDPETSEMTVPPNSDAMQTLVFKQKNTKATRKQVAPLLRDLIAKLG